MSRKRRVRILLGASLAFLLLAGAAAAILHGRRLFLERRLEQVRQDFKLLFKTTAAAGIDFCGVHYPADTAYRRQEDPAAPLTFEWSYNYYRDHGGKNCLLTTPVAYVKQIPADPFRESHRYYDYCAVDRPPNFMRRMAILRSPGPDGRDDLPLGELKRRLEAAYNRDPKKGGTLSLKPEFRGWVRSQVDPYLYDPTNGAASRGDLVLVMDRCASSYGWGGGTGDWASLPPSSFSGEFNPDTVPSPSSDWTLQQPPPEPKNYNDQLWADARVQAPADFIATLGKAGIVCEDEHLYFRDPAGRRPVQERLDRLRNHFGPFISFFETPALLTPDQKEKLEAWRREDPAWWDAVSASFPGNALSMAPVRLQDYLDLLVLYGKSSFLLAADEMAQGKAREANFRLANFYRPVNHLRFGTVAYAGTTYPADWAFNQGGYLTRVHDELSRLASALETLARRQSAGSPGNSWL